MTDPIADMLTRIRNASMVRKASVEMPYSGVKKEIARVLHEEGYIESLEVVEGVPFRSLRLGLKYQQPSKRSAIRAIRRVSKPGCRIYAQHESLPMVLNNLGIAIISTSHGVMTNRQAKKNGLGGEVLCEVS